jgi:uncharacterized protein YndB with AHSA1/START domain
MTARGLAVERRIVLAVPPDRVLRAFFEPHDLARWWQVVRSVTVPRPLGTYALEWRSTDYRDEVLGQLGGAFHGTVMEYRAGAELFVADAYWSPPEGDPIGPMALEVLCAAEGAGTSLQVRQSAEDEGERWRRYFEVVATGWPRALDELKKYLENEAARTMR